MMVPFSAWTVPFRNARALVQLQFGDVEGAMHLLRGALREVGENVGTSTHRFNLADGELRLVFSQDPIQCVDSTTDSESVFRCPCMILPQHGVGDEFDLQNASFRDLNLLAMSLLFNLGLCFQLRALPGVDPGKWSKNVRRAIALYNAALKIVSIIESNDPHILAMIRPVAIAIGNNLAAVLAEVHDRCNLDKCLRWTMHRVDSTNHPELVKLFWTNFQSWNSLGDQAAAAA